MSPDSSPRLSSEPGHRLRTDP
ncbi:hypothetical protein DBR06_SOUSAS910188, partial [Sousa chinensis]